MGVTMEERGKRGGEEGIAELDALLQPKRKNTDRSHCFDFGSIRIVEQFLVVVVEATHMQRE